MIGRPISPRAESIGKRYMMKTPIPGVAALVAMVLVAGCAKHDAESLRTSFVQQVAAIGSVRDLQRTGDDLTFSAPDAAGGEATWRIHIESLILERNDDTLKPYKGAITSSWYMNGTLIEAAGLEAHLPKGFKEKGLRPDASALWDAQTRRWNW